MTTPNLEPVVEIERVSVALEGRDVLEDISFGVAPGELVGICGPNGAGKTTLLRAILGIVPIRTGQIRLIGAPPGDRRSAAGVGYVPQRHAIPKSFPASVADVVALGRLPRGIRLGRVGSDPGHRLAAAEALERVGIGALRDQPVGRLSGGEQRRVLLAQALCASQKLLILDEPTVGLDLPAELEFYRLVRSLTDELGLAVLVVSHDLVALAGRATRLVCINRRMHVHGNPEEVIHSHALQEAYHCEFDFLAGELDHHTRHGPGH
jgi:ABC-type Mn2+/Zn2+ transport system ATPase subunit